MLVFKTHQATCGGVNFYNAGVVTLDRRVGMAPGSRRAMQQFISREEYMTNLWLVG
jgi:hypothetical protein